MIKRNLVGTKKKRGRPKGSKNKKTYVQYTKDHPDFKSPKERAEDFHREKERYTLRSKMETDALDSPIQYYYIYDLNRGERYPEIIARFTVETEAELCTEFLNGIRKISKRKYEEKRVCIL